MTPPHDLKVSGNTADGSLGYERSCHIEMMGEIYQYFSLPPGIVGLDIFLIKLNVATARKEWLIE
jgi:hypothetical protein